MIQNQPTRNFLGGFLKRNIFRSTLMYAILAFFLTLGSITLQHVKVIGRLSLKFETVEGVAAEGQREQHHQNTTRPLGNGRDISKPVDTINNTTIIIGVDTRGGLLVVHVLL